MESVAISGARWVLGKALSPLSGGLVEAWAATTELEPNIEALKTELLYAQAMIDNARGREIRSHALGELLQKLRGLAYRAEDVLDELDYFRIQDELEDTFESVDDRGCGRNLVRDVRHAAAKQLCCASFLSTAPGSNNRADEKSCKCAGQIGSSAHAFGKRLLCSSPLYASDDSKHAPRIQKLKFDRVDVSKKMKCITDELKPLCAKVSTILGLELSGSVIAELRLLGASHDIGKAASSSRSITTSQTLEPILYGRDAHKNTIVEEITKGQHIHRDLTVIPIVGPGGIGKTTLTQHIYNSKTVQDHFNIRAWICVSLDFSVYKLTREIVSSIPKAEDEKNDRPDNEVQNMDQLQKLIEKRLKNRRFLIVLDDMWKYGNEDEWNRFLVPFEKVQGNGGIVLVTTRILEVAEMVKRGDKLLQLEGLEPKEYWSLFLACIFYGTNQQCNDKKLLEIGEKIAEKLKGSPLAAKTVGRLLRHDLTVDHWTRVLESREWESQTSDHDIMPALKPSYDYLPFHLQHCFSSCALFPEDYKFRDEELIHFWIGLDILHVGHISKRIEDIGRHNLNDLVNYGFFKKETDNSGTHYVMHDLLHDLALNVSSQECLHIASSSLRDLEIAPSIYHMSISINDPSDIVEEKFRKGLDKMRNIIKFENLRTLMLFGNYDARFVRIFSDILKNAKSLRVVFLSTTHFPVECLLHNFSKLVHLRYLRLLSERYGCKEHLPTSISRYYHLRVLDISDWHGYLSLLGDMANLVKLRHLLVSSINDESHPNICNVGKLRSLQELQRFDVRKEKSGFEFRELGKLEELGGSLGIYNLENAVVDEAHEAKLSYKNRLKKLTLDWKEGRSNTNPASEDQLLESLRPPNNINELSIKGHGGSTCPTWLGTNLSARGLEALRLDNTDWESLPPLGELYLIRGTGEEYFGCIRGPNFHNLKRLELIGLPRFRRWVANEFCPWYFSVIEVLIVKKCPELTELPFSSYSTYPPEGDLNATWFPRLREIRIVNCPQLLSVPPIPFSHILCSVTLEHVGRGLERLRYSTKPFISLQIKCIDALPSLDETVLAFQYLTQLEELSIENCPPLAGKHLQMLTSLKTLKMTGSSIMFLPLARSDVKWQLPVTRLDIARWSGSAKELTRLLCHLPVLSILAIGDCDKITRLGVEAEQKQMASSLSMPASSVVKLQDTHGTGAVEVEEDVVAEEVVAEQQQEEDDGLLLLPAHLSGSLRGFYMMYCSKLILTVQNGGAGGGGLQFMHSLESLEIRACSEFLSAYKASGLSYCPFPSSLQRLELWCTPLVPLWNLTSLQELIVLGSWGEDSRWTDALSLLTQGQLTRLEVCDSSNFFAGWDPAQALQDGQEQPSSKLQELDTDNVAGVLALPICRLISSSLTKLSIKFNKEVERFTKEQEEALSFLTSLQALQFRWCSKLQCLPSGLHKLTSLETLWIFGCTAIRSLLKYGLPISLQQLCVADCIKLRCLPAGLHKLTNLKRLQLSMCPAIRSLPKNGLPSSLQELDVTNCGNKELEQRCKRLLGTIPIIRL